MLRSLYNNIEKHCLEEMNKLIIIEQTRNPLEVVNQEFLKNIQSRFNEPIFERTPAHC